MTQRSLPIAMLAMICGVTPMAAVASVALPLETRRPAIEIRLVCDQTSTPTSLRSDPGLAALATALGSSGLQNANFQLEYHPRIDVPDHARVAVARACAGHVKSILVEQFGIGPARIVVPDAIVPRSCSAADSCAEGSLVVTNVSD